MSAPVRSVVRPVDDVGVGAGVDGVEARVARLVGEPSTEWVAANEIARALPRPVALPGMPKALAALMKRYSHMPADWLADVVQDFQGGWLLRSDSPGTIARSAVRGVAQGKVATVEAGIAWKLRAELLSRAHRSYRRVHRAAAGERLLREVAVEYAGRVREAELRRFELALGFGGGGSER